MIRFNEPIYWQHNIKFAAGESKNLLIKCRSDTEIDWQ